MTETNDPVAADFLLVNSCAVTARAIRDLRQTVRRLHRLAPEARIVVTGMRGPNLLAGNYRKWKA